MKKSQPRTWLITGGRGAGKTRFCTRLVEKARQLNLDIAGVLSPPVFQGDTKTGIEIEALQTGERRLLAVKRIDGSNAISTQRWTFDDKVLKWGNAILAKALPCQLLVIDELGTLEFERQMGLLNGIKALESERFISAVVVIRPELLEKAKHRFKTDNIIEIPPDLSARKENEFFEIILFNLKH